MKTNKNDSDEKMMKLIEDFNAIIASSITSIIDHINTSKSSPDHKDSTKPPDPTTVVPDNRRSSPLHSGNSTEIGAMWTLKHEISSPKFCELPIKTELKVDTALDLKNF